VAGLQRARYQWGGFLLGLLYGLLAAGAAFALLVAVLPAESLARFHGAGGALMQGAWDFTSLNLRSSILPFSVVLLVYWLQLHKLGGLLAAGEPELIDVVRCEQALDLCATLFFGIGVIWTAIGMRDALLFALGDRETAATQSAFFILQRLVDGGILLALSTTIVGGVGGYLMRALKSIAHGRSLTTLYMDASQRPVQQSLDALHRIEGHLALEALPPACAREGP